MIVPASGSNLQRSRKIRFVVGTGTGGNLPMAARVIEAECLASRTRYSIKRRVFVDPTSEPSSEISGSTWIFQGSFRSKIAKHYHVFRFQMHDVTYPTLSLTHSDSALRIGPCRMCSSPTLTLLDADKLVDQSDRPRFPSSEATCFCTEQRNTSNARKT